MKLRLWLVGLLLGKQSEVMTIDRSVHHLILVDDRLFGYNEMRGVGKACGSCTVIPIRMSYIPEGTKIKDVLAFFPIK